MNSTFVLKFECNSHEQRHKILEGDARVIGLMELGSSRVTEQCWITTRPFHHMTFHVDFQSCSGRSLKN